MSTRKTCLDCGVAKPATPVHFYTRRGSDLQPRCKGCDNLNRTDRRREHEPDSDDPPVS